MIRTTRRGFFKHSTAIGIGFAVGMKRTGFAASEKIRVTCIGVRGRGSSVM